MIIILVITFVEWKHWWKHFAKRPRRSDSKCPSHKRRPGLKNMDGGASYRFRSLPRILRNEHVFSRRESSASNSTNSHSTLSSEAWRMTRNETAITYVDPSTGDSYPSWTYARNLSMDHLYMSFTEYLWLTWHLTPPVFGLILFGGPKTNGIFGILWMNIVEWLGLFTKNSPDVVERKLVDLILGTSIVTWITDITHNEDEIIGNLLIPQAMHVFCNKTVTAGDFKIRIDIQKGKILACTFLNKNLELGDALTLTFMALVGHTHPVIHSYANWGINPDSNDKFLRRMAICTIKYNNMGMTSYPKTVDILRRLGVLKYATYDVCCLSIHQGPHTVPPHTNLFHLAEHSEFVEFIVKVRRFFLSEFMKHKHDFPGIDGEALFIGTVLHSVDHCQAAHLVDITDFRGSEYFLASREVATVVLSCFTDQHYFALFERRMSHAPHPFYRRVYEFAATINTRMADCLECTIAL